MNFISAGGDGDICRIKPGEVVKIEHRWDDLQPSLLSEGNNARERNFCEIIARHPNDYLVPIIDARATDGIHMKEMTCGDLESKLNENSISISILQKIHWIDDIMQAVAFLWRLGYIHGDLRPPNILFDDEGQLRLCDFGGAVDIGALLAVRHIPFWDGYCEEAGVETPFSNVEAYDMFDLIDEGRFPPLDGVDFKGSKA